MSGSEDYEASGVEALIDRLKAEGVEAGQQEARRVVEDAEKRASWLVSQAQDEAEQILKRARQEAERFEAAGHQALEVGVRDALLRLKSELANLFHEELHRQVHDELRDPETLKRIILVLAGNLGEELSALDDFKLPERVMDLEELRHNPEELESGLLTNLTRSLARDMLGSGVMLLDGDAEGAGIRVQVGGERIELDFTDATVTRLLQMHLQPRFRALMEGMVR